MAKKKQSQKRKSTAKKSTTRPLFKTTYAFLGLLLVVIILAFSVYYHYHQLQTRNLSQELEGTPVSHQATPTSLQRTKLYTSNTYKYQISFPSETVYTADDNSTYGLTSFSLNCLYFSVYVLPKDTETTKVSGRGIVPFDRLNEIEALGVSKEMVVTRGTKGQPGYSEYTYRRLPDTTFAGASWEVFHEQNSYENLLTDLFYITDKGGFRYVIDSGTNSGCEEKRDQTLQNFAFL